MIPGPVVFQRSQPTRFARCFAACRYRVQHPEGALGQPRIGGRLGTQGGARRGDGDRQVLPVQADNGWLGRLDQGGNQLGCGGTDVRSFKFWSSLDRDPSHRGVVLYGLHAAQRGGGQHPGARSEASQQAGERGGVLLALRVQRAVQVVGALVAGRRMPHDDQRHGRPRNQGGEDITVVRVGQPVARGTERQPGDLVDLVAGFGLLVGDGGPVTDLLGQAADQVGDRLHWWAEHRADTGLLQRLADRGDQQVLAGLALALRQRPVVVLGPVHQQHLRTQCS